MSQDVSAAGPTGAGGPESIESILLLRKLTRAVGEQVRGQMMEFLGTLSPLLRPKVVLGDYIHGGAKEPARRADKAFKELQGLYESIAVARPFNLPRDLGSPIELPSTTLEVTPFEYVHAAQTGGEPRPITVRAPLTWVLGYSGYPLSRLRELLDAKNRSNADVQRCLLNYLVLHVVIQNQPGVTALLETLRFPVSTFKMAEFGDLPLVRIGASISTYRPSDRLVVQSAELSGMDAFEEVVNVSDLTQLRDGFKDRLLDIVRSQTPSLLPSA